MNIKSTKTPALILNALDWFKQKDFINWINDESNPLMTWHKRGESPTEWSDLIVLIDPSLNGEGSDSDTMPIEYWSSIIKICRAKFKPTSGHHIIVRITNLTE